MPPAGPHQQQNQYNGPGLGGPPPPNSTQSLPRGGRLNSQGSNYGNDPRQNRQVMRRDVPPNGSLDRRPGYDMPDRNNYPVDNYGRPMRPDQQRMEELKQEMDRRGRSESDPSRPPPGRDGYRPDPRGPPPGRGPDPRGHDPRGPDPRGYDPRDPRAHDPRGPPRGPDPRGPRGPPDPRQGPPDPRQGPPNQRQGPHDPRQGPPDPRQHPDPRYRGEPPRDRNHPPDPRYVHIYLVLVCHKRNMNHKPCCQLCDFVKLLI